MKIKEIKKAIELLECFFRENEYCQNKDCECMQCKIDREHCEIIALQCMKNELERIENKPLTLEQLKNMYNNHQSVWIVWNDSYATTEQAFVKIKSNDFTDVICFDTIIKDVRTERINTKRFDGFTAYKYKSAESEE